MIRPVLLALLIAAVPARAEFRVNGAGLQLYSPQQAWAVTLPRGDWQVLEEKIRAGDTGAYYFVASPSREIQFSVLIERTEKCSSGVTCRELWKANPPAAFATAREATDLERGVFSAVRFYIDKPANAPVSQANLVAHAYRDGYWIDVRVSKVGETRPDFEPLLAVLDAIAIKPKMLDGARQYAAGSGRYVAFDIPPEWRDALAPKNVGAIELVPALGDGFKALLTILPPKKTSDPPPTKEEVLASASKDARDVSAQAVEGKVEPREFRGKSAWGYRFSATDKAPAPGEYPYLTQGVLVVGNVQVGFTILSREGEKKSVVQALDAIASARMAP